MCFLIFYVHLFIHSIPSHPILFASYLFVYVSTVSYCIINLCKIYLPAYLCLLGFAQITLLGA